MTTPSPLLRFHQPAAELYVPRRRTLAEAIAHTAYLGVGAHPDDLELMAAYPILQGMESHSSRFSGVVVADGAGSPGGERLLTDQEMRILRRQEQREAADLGNYAALFQLAYPSSVLKGPGHSDAVDDLEKILKALRPQEVYTHNLADKHDTHVAVLLKLVAAIRRLPMDQRPRRLIGCEAWRDLDWLSDEDKVAMPVENLAVSEALIKVFQSQIQSGKRYDLAALGRRRAHATYQSSHTVDKYGGLILGMDMTPLMLDDSLSPEALFARLAADFENEVKARIKRLSA
jgi:LmbE family N-acetylglucosaminyl deacetylase